MTTVAARAAHSLDESTKSPTDVNELLAWASREEKERKNAGMDAGVEGLLERSGRYVVVKADAWAAIKRDKDTKALYTPLDMGDVPRRAVLITETKGKLKPPCQRGDRWTGRLSPKAPKVIGDAARYAHRIGYGFTTFATLTLESVYRRDLKIYDAADAQTTRSGAYWLGDLRPSLGNWVADLINKMQINIQRGFWLRDDDGKRLSYVKPRKTPLCYVWVAENPGNENPHVHLMINWRVRQKEFLPWAAWWERQWGKGYCKLIKLKHPNGAAGYMAKAAKYVAKGTDGEQGRVRGNRYSVARLCRAPVARGKTYYASWIHKALALMKNSDKEKRPEGLWASAWAFGTKNEGAWKKVWRALRDDGFLLQVAPVSFGAARLRGVMKEWERWQSGPPWGYVWECLEDWNSFVECGECEREAYYYE